MRLKNSNAFVKFTAKTCPTVGLPDSKGRIDKSLRELESHESIRDVLGQHGLPPLGSPRGLPPLGSLPWVPHAVPVAEGDGHGVSQFVWI